MFRVAAVTCCALLALYLAAPVAQTSEEAPAAQRYLPDQDERWQPTEPQRKVLYAEKLILRGPNCEITIDATGQQPGIVVQSSKTGERCHVYISREGNAVMGVTTPARKELAAGIFADRRTGYLQVAEPRGVHLLTGKELGRGFGRLEE